MDSGEDESGSPPPGRQRRVNTHEVSDDSDGESTDSADLQAQITALVNTGDSPVTDDNCLAAFADQLELETDAGPPLSTQVADILQSIATKRLPEDKMRDKIGAIKLPPNCPALVSVRVNPEIWDKLRAVTRSRDLRMQRVHVRLVKSLGAMAYAIDGITSLLSKIDGSVRPDVKSALNGILDAFLLEAGAVQELHQRRKELIKSDLDDKFQRLCGPDVPVSNLLFGNDLAKLIKDIVDTAKLSANICRTSADKPRDRRRPLRVHSHFRNRAKNHWSKNGGQSVRFKDRRRPARPVRQ